MDVLKVSPAELEAFSGKIQSSSAELDSILDTLRARLDAMQWTGGDQAAYFQQRTEWDTAVRDLNMLLNKIGQTVGLAKQDYVSTESANAKMFMT
ncbi:WXG100 family type VII secretion target [Stackebrandtia albiflava]|uniref:ESAT-6-like protein n=1 Tax=Stackebrandtia albiflava TaxID=406432 RepID=A0A562V3Q4_9ACTN|nr:WXG100 family type VII secretion target [Stackebrandtia albiflava]TWJ12485.1 WXG100 family type VII secretion target [Stackebrandtia albiflava]